jgi:ribonucleoside-diphosphate reductase alpha chain
MPKNLTHITKRDGRKVKFNSEKITQAIYKAFIGSGEVEDEKKRIKESERLTPIAVDLFTKIVNGNKPTVETMQDTVEQILMAAGYYQTAKAYILYRQRHSKKRAVEHLIGIEDDLNLSVNQLKVIKSRYIRHSDTGKPLETPKKLFRRVACAIAGIEKKDQKEWEKKFYNMLTKFEFMPGGCYLRSAGTDNPMLANCFVLPIEDSMEGIFDSVKYMALVHQKGGGTGFNFSSLRPKGDSVSSSGGFSSGPISFMKVFDAATRQVMQGGFKRGANMGILNIDHPDILDFITCKTEENEINNFNISVGITDKFMQTVEDDTDFELLNPRNGEVVQTVSAQNLFNQIVTLSWRTGDPGLIFLDEINRHNPVIDTQGPMITTNPCGEQPLHPFDVCNLGSINLSSFFNSDNSNINWKRLDEVIRLAVRFQDNGVDLSTYPIPQIADMAKANRRIGLGVMGWADLLFKLQIPYNSDEAFTLAEKISHFIYSVSHNESERLAEEKGTFPNYKGSTYEKKKVKQRNLAITTIAPTGTISMVSGCSSGIEPVFLLSYTKNVVDDNGLTYTNPSFKKALQKHFDDEIVQDIIDKVTQTGTCQNIKEIPDEIKQVFVTAHDITWQDHIKMQAAFQKWTDNAVSKTINFPNSATLADIEKAYLLAWQLKCKGVTIYRDGSKSFQILQATKSEKSSKSSKSPVIQSKIKVKSLKQRMNENNSIKKEVKTSNTQKKKIYKSSSELCPECNSKLQMSEGCSMCLSCGFSKCSL